MILDQNKKWSPEWLVSVRDLSEAETVSRFGVDFLDWKNPSEGPLAPVSIAQLRQAGEWVSKKRASGNEIGLLSAALGEPSQAEETAGHVPDEFQFAKSGPSGLTSSDALREHWNRLRSKLPSSVELVAVAYADHEKASALTPELILETAVAVGLKRILIDTFDKRSGSSTQIMGEERLGTFGRLARSNQLWWSLAGALTLEDAMELVHEPGGRGHLPDCVAVRGDICRSTRTSDLCSDRLRKWQRWIGVARRKPSGGLSI